MVVYGTQPGFNESTGNAIDAMDGMTPQHKTVENFYNETQKKVEKHNGKITNMSGYSQSGPAVAKVAADHKVDKITNFADWGASSAVKNGDITAKDIAYLNEHATIYVDSDRDLINISGGGGQIPYGKEVVVEGSHGIWIGDHNYAYAEIKGNGPNVNWYIKHNQFCSGMTKEQVIKVAKAKAKAAKKWSLTDPGSWTDSTDYHDYVKEYEKTYGGYASSTSPKGGANKHAVTFSHLADGSYYSLLRSASGSKRIKLEQGLLALLSTDLVAQKEDFQSRYDLLVAGG